MKTVHKFEFSHFNEEHEICENYVIEEGEKEKSCWEDPV